MTGKAEEVYAQSLFEVAREDGELPQIAKELETVAALLKEQPDFVRLLSSPAMSRKEKIAIAGSVFDQTVSSHLANFIKVLADHGRIAAFDGICTAFRAHYDRHTGVLPVTAVTAVEMPARLREKLQNKLAQTTGKKILLDCQVDPTVIGGVLLRYDNKEIDGTVREKLTALRRQLAGRMV